MARGFNTLQIDDTNKGILGYAAVEIALAVLTFGGVTGAKWAGKMSAKAIQIIKEIPGVAKLAAQVSKIKIPALVKDGLKNSNATKWLNKHRNNVIKKYGADGMKMLSEGVIAKRVTKEGYTLKVLFNGKIVRCSTCGELAKEFAKELADPKNSKLAEELSKLQKIATENPEAVVDQIKQLESQLQKTRLRPKPSQMEKRGYRPKPGERLTKREQWRNQESSRRRAKRQQSVERLIGTIEQRGRQIEQARGDIYKFRATFRQIAGNGNIPCAINNLAPELKKLLTSYYRIRTQTGGRHNTSVSTIIESLDGKFSIRITHNQVGTSPIGNPPGSRIHIYEGPASGHGNHVLLQPGTTLNDILKSLSITP